MAGKMPYIPFFTADWLADEKLRLCSLAARGLWMDLLCLMHKCDRRGFLQQVNGQPYSHEQIARIAGCSSDEVAHMLQELISSGVASVSDTGVIFSRRMMREEQLRECRSVAGRRGAEVTNSLPAVLPRQKSQQNAGNDVGKTAASIPDPIPVSEEERKDPPNPPQAGGTDAVRKVRKPKTADPDGFAEFWQAYPRKVARAAALKAWIKLAPDEPLRLKIWHAIEVQRRSVEWKKDGGQFIPHPASWLNGKRWEDVEGATVKPAPTAAERAARIRADREKAARERESAVNLADFAAKLAEQRAKAASAEPEPPSFEIGEIPP